MNQQNFFLFMYIFVSEHDPPNTKMVATHPHFRSIDPKVQDAETIESHVGEALTHQIMFDKRAPPWELSQWADGELDRFQIKLSQVDGLYYIDHIDDETGQAFVMVARMNYNGRHVFVELRASCDFSGFDCQGGGYIFVCNDADSFMSTVITSEYQRYHVIMSMLSM